MSPKFKRRLCLWETGRGEREEKGFVTAPEDLCVWWKMRGRRQTWRGDGKGRNEDEQDRVQTSLMVILFRVFHKTEPTKKFGLD